MAMVLAIPNFASLLFRSLLLRPLRLSACLPVCLSGLVRLRCRRSASAALGLVPVAYYPLCQTRLVVASSRAKWLPPSLLSQVP
jgi:hypothetical protein